MGRQEKKMTALGQKEKDNNNERVLNKNEKGNYRKNYKHPRR